jgi:hypothetical protein
MSIQERIAAMAEKYVDRTDWAYDTPKDNIPKDRWKCNKFVHDVLLEAGLDMGLPNGNLGFGGKYPINAGEWGDPNIEIKGWEVVPIPRKGDIAAYQANYTDASGHVGIIVNNEGMGVWAGKEIVKRGYVNVVTWHTSNNIIFRRFVGFPPIRKLIDKF